MLIDDFEYLTPATLGEACEALSMYSGQAAVLAGGTDLIPEMKRGKQTPKYVIDLKFVRELDQIVEDGGNLRIGAMTRLRTIETSDLVRKHCPLLAQAASVVGSVQIRNRATIGGNIAHASPSADTAPSMVALGSTLRIVGVGGERLEGIETFFTGVCCSCLREGEILAEFIVPKRQNRESGVYIKHTIRKAMDLAIVGVAAIVRANQDGASSSVRLGLGSVGPTPIRPRKAEALLENQRLDEALIREAAQVAAGEIRPRSSIRASAEYRTQMTEVLVRRAILQAARAI
jgi:CO/xanthine dehydrogenase FAD-binding subunit